MKMKKITKELYLKALQGRFIGCLIGVPVENYSIKRMQELAKEGHQEFPIKNFWKVVERENDIQYGVSPRYKFSLDYINQVEVDDDITYTVLNILLLEKYGFNYTKENLKDLWLDLLPYACTAEDVALQNLKKGIPVENIKTNLDMTDLIGAAIREDVFGYICPNEPKKAYDLAYTDSSFTHSNDGLLGGQLVSAVIACAFHHNNPYLAFCEGMEYLPKNSRLYQELKKANNQISSIHDYLQARKYIDEHYQNMDCVHIINNMVCLLFGLYLGQNSYLDAVSNTISIGLDNDCTGATAGSIASICFENVDEFLTKKIGDRVLTYLKGYEIMSLNDLADRIYKLYERMQNEKK